MDTVSLEVSEIATTIMLDRELGSVRDVSAITGRGQVNQIYLITTSLRKAILRLNSLSEIDRFKKEQYCMQAVRDLGIKTPDVFGIGFLEKYAYIILEYIEGRNGADIIPDVELWKSLGALLRRIHRVPTNRFGEQLGEITGAPTQDGWSQYLSYNISKLTDDDRLIAEVIISPEQSLLLKEKFEMFKSQEFTFGLSHGDFSLANVIVDATDRPYIIDWGSAGGHIVPHHDLGIILEESLSEDSVEFSALLEGYSMSRADFDAIKDDIHTLRQLEAIDKLRWAFDKAPERIEHYRDLLTRLINVY